MFPVARRIRVVFRTFCWAAICCAEHVESCLHLSVDHGEVLLLDGVLVSVACIDTHAIPLCGLLSVFAGWSGGGLWNTGGIFTSASLRSLSSLTPEPCRCLWMLLVIRLSRPPIAHVTRLSFISSETLHGCFDKVGPHMLLMAIRIPERHFLSDG